MVTGGSGRRVQPRPEIWEENVLFAMLGEQAEKYARKLTGSVAGRFGDLAVADVLDLNVSQPNAVQHLRVARITCKWTPLAER